MLKKLTSTGDGWAPLVLRLTLGLVIFPHGAQKLLGWYGGGGFSGTLDFFGGQLGIPAFITVLVIVGEFFGALALIAGFLTRFCAASIGVIMLGAMFMIHWGNGFFMNWYGVPDQGQGYEYHLLAIGIAVALMITGGGKWSVDGRMGG